MRRHSDMILGPHHRLLGLYLVFMLVPAAGLMLLGWRLAEQEGSLARQQEKDRLAETAQFVGLALGERISVSRQLAAPAPGAISVSMTGSGVEATPKHRLLYYPNVLAEPPAEADIFAAAENLELRREDYAGAMEELRRVGGSADPAIRAGSLLRTARIARKTGHADAALAAYQHLEEYDGLPVEGVPAGLIAVRARCALLFEAGHSQHGRSEASRLLDGLLTGRWRLSQAAYQLHVAEAEQWTGRSDPRRAELEVVAQAVHWLWQQWRGGRLEDPGKPRTHWLDAGGHPVALDWRWEAGRLEALVATAGFAAREWFEPVGRLARDRAACFQLQASDGTVVWGDGGPAASTSVIRGSPDSGLPWTLVVWREGGAPPDVTAGDRRRLLLGLFGLVSLSIAVSAYFVTRAMSRELLVARLQSDFVAAVSHEFRTPLTAMLQFTEYLQDRRVTDEARRAQYYGAISRAAKRLHRLVDALLESRRLEAGAITLRLEPLPVEEWFLAETGAFAREAAELGYTLQTSVSGIDAGSRIPADAALLSRALWNLMENAMKYSSAETPIQVALERRKNRILLSVKDRGMGVPESERRLVFQRFFRGAQATAKGIRGTGLGLALVQQIADAHGGRVRLESSPGQGSTFILELPEEEA